MSLPRPGPLWDSTVCGQPPPKPPHAYLSHCLEAAAQLASGWNGMPSTHSFILSLACPIEVTLLSSGASQTPSHRFIIVIK